MRERPYTTAFAVVLLASTVALLLQKADLSTFVPALARGERGECYHHIVFFYITPYLIHYSAGVGVKRRLGPEPRG